MAFDCPRQLMSTKASNYTTSDLFRTFYHRRIQMLVVFCLVSLAAILVVWFYPKTYTSEGRLFVRLGRESVSLDPTATTAGEIVSLNESRESEINSAVEILRSRLLIERVVDEIGIDNLLGRAQSTSESAISPQDRDAVISQLSKKIEIDCLKKSSVIAITARARTPDLARQITATLIDVYLKHHLQVYSTPGSLDFFHSQVELIRRDLDAAERAISERKSGLQLISTEGKRASLLAQISDVEIELLIAERGLSAAIARHQALEQSLSDLPSTVLAEEVSGLPNAAADSMRGRLYELEIRERELQSTLKDDHPRLVAIRKQIKESRDVLSDQPEQRQQQTHRLNLNAESLHFELLSEGANVSSLTAHRAALISQQHDLMSQLEQFNRDEIEIGSLQRHVDRLTSEFSVYSQRLEQARINAALLEQQITNVNVVQPATLALKPVSPNRRMLTALGLLMALASAVGIALISDAIKPSVTSPEQLAGYLGIPVLASIPIDERYRLLIRDRLD